MKHQGGPRARRVPVATNEPLVAGDRFDYADAFEIRVREPDARSAEHFVRAALEHAPGSVRRTIRSVHRYVLGLRPDPRSSPDHLLGWKIVTSEHDVFHLEAESAVLRGVLVLRRADPTCAVITTYLFYKRPATARALWRIIGPLHRRIAPYLMERAAAIAGAAESPVAAPPERVV